MQILIYGSSGWIGKQFIKLLNSHKYIEGKSRLNDIETTKKEIDEIKPTHVFCFICRTHGSIGEKEYTTIDYLEQPGKLTENVKDNLFSPISLAKICEERNIHLTYLGTGCIFEFDDNHPFGKEENGFTELSKPNFFGSGYSIVKGFTDQLMKLFNKNVLNLRIRMPITDIPNSRNFITKITNYEKICSVPNSMSVLPELLPFVLQLAEQNYTGTLNLTNPGLISHNEILEMYKEIVDNSFEWKNFSEDEQSKILAAGRSNNYLETVKLKELFPHVKNIKESVRNILLEYKKNFKNTKFEESTEFISNDHNYKYNNSTDFKGNEILLITGGCGFIASNFINHIFYIYDNIQIINIDAMYYCANENNVDYKIRNSDRYTFIKGNICSEDLVTYIFKFYQPTIVIHFAAQSHVQNSFTDALQYTKDNILGTHTLLEVSRKYNKLKKIIHVSTDEVYGESLMDENENCKTEKSILCPTNPYSATKASAELIAQSYYYSFKMPIIITRGNNVYGPNQYPEKLIPRFIKLLNENKIVTIQGDGSCMRSFLYSSDTSKAFELIMIKGKIGEIYNIGCEENMEYSVMQIAKKIIKKIKKTDNFEDWIEYIEDRPFNDKRYYISNTKLKKLGWSVEIDIDQGLELLIK